ncbi:MAG: hypothetical protein WAT79_17015 [Saprospiraceae bacterium]
MANRNQIEDAIQDGYEFRIGYYFSKAFEYFKENAGEFIGFTLVYLIISIVNSFIPYIGTLISLIISGPLSLGAMIFAHRMNTNQSLEFSNFFDGFKKLLPLFTTYLITLVVYLIISMPIYFVLGNEFFSVLSSNDPEQIIEAFSEVSKNSGLFFSVFIIFIYAAVSLRWALAMVYFYDYSPIEAIKQSFLIVNKKWIYHLGFLLVCILVGLLGLLALFVGLLVAIPIISIADYVGFSDVTGLGSLSNNEDENISIDELV